MSLELCLLVPVEGCSIETVTLASIVSVVGVASIHEVSTGTLHDHPDPSGTPWTVALSV
jgi:hypothetical protein